MQTVKILAVCAMVLCVPRMISLSLAQPASVSFDAEAKPPPPDYASAGAWAAKPTAPAHKVDVFYVHPTTYPGPAWNQDVADRAINAVTDDGVMKTQATAFSGCCDLYAPRYRQASLNSLAAIKGDGGKAYDLAYQDVRRAFEHYLDHDNHGRPFILVGHSQGALQIARLLEEMVDGKPVGDRLVAAYVVGIGVSKGQFGKAYKTVGICGRPDDTGCVVSWNSFVRGSDVAAYIQRSEGRYVQRFGDDPGKALLCVNPLTFDLMKPDGDPALHLGAIDGSGHVSKPGLVGAGCAGGVLFVDPPQDPGLLKPLPGGVLHMQDVELFYGNLRDNAVLRSEAWLARAGKGKTQ